MEPLRVCTADRVLVRAKSIEVSVREPRVRVSMRASVQVSAELSVAVQIVDLSRLGFGLISEEPLQAGQVIELSNRKDASIGKIRWVRGLKAGGSFTELPRITE